MLPLCSPRCTIAEYLSVWLLRRIHPYMRIAWLWIGTVIGSELRLCGGQVLTADGSMAAAALNAASLAVADAGQCDLTLCLPLPCCQLCMRMSMTTSLCCSFASMLSMPPPVPSQGNPHEMMSDSQWLDCNCSAASNAAVLTNCMPGILL